MKSFLPLLIAASLLPAAAWAKTNFDIAPDKPDSLIAARDAVRAWRAAGHSNEAAIIQLKRGDYTLTQPLVLGTQDVFTVWYARDPENTTVSGGRRILGFHEVEGGLWSAKTDLKFEQLYVNGHHATRARMPDSGYFKVAGLKHEKQANGQEKIMLRLPDEVIAALPQDEATLRDVNLLMLHKWDTTRAFIAALDRTTKMMTIENALWKPWNAWGDNCRFSFENFRAALNAPDEWFLERDGTLLYKPKPGEKISKTEVIAPVVENFLVIRGSSHVRFDGLHFRHAGYHVPEGGNAQMQAAAFVEAAIQIDHADHIEFENCEVANVATYGIWFRTGCTDGLIKHCLFEDLGAGGIRIGETSHDISTPPTERIVADNNIIRGTGFFHPSACGLIVAHSGNNRVTHNDISDTTYTGISVGWTWGYGPHRGTNNFIGYNRVHNIGQGMLSDMGGIYTLGNGAGSQCIGNLFYDVRAHDYGGWGIYHDEGSTGWLDESNISWNCTCVTPSGGNGFHQHYGKENRLVNNIFANSSGPLLHATRVEPHTSVMLEHNLFINDNAPLIGGLAKVKFESSSNCYVSAKADTAFAGKNFAAWQAAGHDAGSIVLTNLIVKGDWPDIALPKDSPAFAIGFRPIDSSQAGVYGDSAWKKRAGH